MAEILGTVASGLAVAEVGLKVGGTVWKLKKLWQQVHEVPETIKDLMKQIEILDPILCDHETNFGVRSTGLLEKPRTQNSSRAMLSTEYCRQALNDILNLVEDLDGAIESEKTTRRTVARLRVVLKKDTIKGFQERLDRAAKLLQGSQMTYLVANTMMTGAMVTNMWTAITDMQQKLSDKSSSNSTRRSPFPPVTQSLDAPRERAQAKAKGVQHQAAASSKQDPMTYPRLYPFGALQFNQSKTETGDGATYAVRFQLPMWFSHKVWDVRVNRACFGWQASLSIWNIVPDDSPGMVCVMKGDLDGLVDLFNRGLASSKDCDTDGYNMLFLASIHSHAHIVQFLCNTNLHQHYIEAIRPGGVISTITHTPMDILQQLVSRGLTDTLADAAEDFELTSVQAVQSWGWVHASSILALIWASNSPEVFELYFRAVFPFWHNLPPKRKQDILMLDISHYYYYPGKLQFWAATEMPTWNADGLRLLLSPDRHVRPSDVQAWIGDGTSMLHQVFVCFLKPESCAATQDCPWEVLLKEVIEATDDVHYRVQVSPFGFLGTITALQLALFGVLSQIRGFELYSLDGIDHTRTIHRLLKRTVVKLQTMMSSIANSGYDLLEFGRREAETWGVELYPDRKFNVGDKMLHLGIGGENEGFPYIRAIHYGSNPKDWYFEMDFHYEDFAGDFWNLLENPHLFMVPGAWID